LLLIFQPVDRALIMFPFILLGFHIMNKDCVVYIIKNGLVCGLGKSSPALNL